MSVELVRAPRHAKAPVQPAHPTHPLGRKARVLLCSVFGPYAQDDEHSRRINPMELYENQVTRVQGPFSLRMFHRTWALMLIQANLDAPCTVLDFPTLERFIEELRTKTYDVIGISAIMPNVGKVAKMCALIRQYQPQAKIVVGGHVTSMPFLQARIDADHIVRGEGVAWFRNYLGLDAKAPVRHPYIQSGFGTRTMGVPVTDRPGETAATLIPSVGCPMGCNFCATSAMFGGKGKFIHFYDTGDALFDVMCGLEKAMNVRSFFVMDENFLLYRKRALRLLELMEQHDKSWTLYVFSSANILQSYTIEQLVRLGISWAWMGLEGKNSQYQKLDGVDTVTFVRFLQSHGISVLGSSIIGLEEHTPETIDEAIEHAVLHSSDFHQFMLYTPWPGTPLGAEHVQKGSLLEPGAYDDADIHGQLRFNFRHPHLRDGQEGALLLKAFRRDFEENGPSVLRMIQTKLLGWQRYKHHPNRAIRDRYRWETRKLPTTFAGALWAAVRYFRDNQTVAGKLEETLRNVCAEYGWRPRILAPVLGRLILRFLRAEERRLASGWTYEPPTFYEPACSGAIAPQTVKAAAAVR